MKFLVRASFALVLFLAPVAAAFADATAAPTAGQVVTVQTGRAGVAAPTGQPAGSTTTTITTAAPPIVIPWGDWLDAIINQIVLPLLAIIVSGLVTAAVAIITPRLPSWLQGYFNAKNTAALEQILVPAIATGLKNTATNVQGQAISFNAQSPAVDKAAQYVIDHGPANIIAWAGGPAGIRAKVQARFDMLDTGVTASSVSTVAPTTSVAAAPVVVKTP